MTIWDWVHNLYALTPLMFAPVHLSIHYVPHGASTPWETMGQTHGKTGVWQQGTFRHLAKQWNPEHC